MIETALIKDAAEMDWTDTASFLLSYGHFISFFQKSDPLSAADFVIAAHFTYGWMPTILDFRPNKLEKCVAILNKVRNHQEITDEEIQALIGVVNGSLVGVSKLLHFIDPHKYAIWDSNVCEYLNNRTENRWKIADIESYRNYLILLAELSNKAVLGELRNLIAHRLGDVSDLRLLEMVMFLMGRKMQAEKKQEKKKRRQNT